MQYELRIRRYPPLADGKVKKVVLEGLLKMGAEYSVSNTSKEMPASETEKALDICSTTKVADLCK